MTSQGSQDDLEAWLEKDHFSNQSKYCPKATLAGGEEMEVTGGSRQDQAHVGRLSVLVGQLG